MRTLLLLTLSCFLSINLFSQFTLSGRVLNEDGDPLQYVSLVLDETTAIKTDETGKYAFKNVSDGTHKLDVYYLLMEKTLYLDVSENRVQDIRLNTLQSFDKVIVNATRAQEKTPMTYTTIGREEIQKKNIAVAAPYVMKWTPSVVVTSDAGAGVGYTGIRIRGTDPTRINVTINGIPFNDAESQSAYWVDIPDILGSTDDIQIQRGVGTSSQGAAAFGATINVNTLNPHRTPFGHIELGYGSFNTRNIRLSLGTGMLNDKFYLEGRLSHIDSDGYVDRASSLLNSYYISTGYQGESTSVKLVHFTGQERTYQSWFGLPAQYLTIDSLRTYNEAGQEKDGAPYADQVDNYLQSHTQLHFIHAFNRNTTANLSFHYTSGSGYYEEYKAEEAFSDYGISPIILASDTINTTDLIRRRWLDNHFFGAIGSVQYKNSDKFKLILGGGINYYLGDHYGQVIWARYASDTENPHQYYFNDAIKNDMNAYVKSLFKIVPDLYGFLDLQFRNVSYTFQGINRNGENIYHTVNLPFFNPKAGLTYMGLDNQKLYLSVALTHREPNRDDYTESTIDELPSPEQMIDIESGYELNHSHGFFKMNAYAMLYRNQLILTGEINDIGDSPRVNVDDSYRIGLELSTATTITDRLSILVGGTVSRNRIKEFQYYVDNWKTGGQELTGLHNTHISFSPEFLLQGGLVYHYEFAGSKQNDSGNTATSQSIEVSVLSKYVGVQYMDNTSFDESRLPAYYYTDLQIVYNVILDRIGEFRLNLKISNLFNRKYSTNGWIYRFYSPESYLSPNPYRVEERKGESVNRYSQRGYYPQAGIHYNLGVSLLF